MKSINGDLGSSVMSSDTVKAALENIVVSAETLHRNAIVSRSVQPLLWVQTKR